MKEKKAIGNWLYYLLSFLIPFVIIIVIFAVNGIYPFGDKTVLNGDAAQQYYPFLMMLRNTVQEGRSLLYTWKSGMGISMIPTVAYYVSSPLNLVCVFLPEAWCETWLTFAVCIRFGFAGLFFTVLAKTVRQKLNIFAPLFGTFFALCGWMLVSYWQIIWLDTVALTPLVLAGLIQAVRDHDYRLYPVALGLSLFCNFFMGFITSMMIGFCWIGLMIILRKPLREIPKEAGRFLGLSVLGAVVCAVFFVPVIYVISNAARAETGVISFTEFYEPISELLGQLSSLTFPVINNHPPTLQSSVLVLMLPLLFLTARRIDLRERIFCIALVCFLMFSLWYEPLNIMWHGFHFPGGTVDRFAYLIPLVLAYIGWRYTENMADEKASVRQAACSLLLMVPLPVIVLICAAKAETTDIPLVSAIYCVIYAAIYVFRMLKPAKRFWFAFGLILLAGFETVLNSYSYVMRKAVFDSLTVREEPVTEAVRLIQDDMDVLQLSRTGIAPSNTPSCNAELLYDIPYGASSFNSLNDYSLQRLNILLGDYNAADSCLYKYNSLSPFAAQLLNLQYAVSEISVPGYQCLSEQPVQQSVSEDDEENRIAAAFKSEYQTYPGFCIAKDVPVDGQQDFQLMDLQNRLFRELTGIEKPLAEQYIPEITEFSDVTANETGVYLHVQADDMIEGEDPPHAHVLYQHQAEESGIWYCTVNYNINYKDQNEKQLGLILVKSKVDGQLYLKHNYLVAGAVNAVEQMVKPIGYVEAGQEIEITAGFMAGFAAEYSISLYRMNEDVFQQGYEILTRNPFTVTEFADSRLTGTVQADEDCLLYLSLPYDKGWKAEVDGQPTEIQPVLDAMTGIPLKAGQHTVKLRFFPRGLAAGIVISAVSLTCYGWLVFRQMQRRKKEQLEEKAHADA